MITYRAETIEKARAFAKADQMHRNSFTLRRWLVGEESRQLNIKPDAPSVSQDYKSTIKQKAKKRRQSRTCVEYSQRNSATIALIGILELPNGPPANEKNFRSIIKS